MSLSIPRTIYPTFTIPAEGPVSAELTLDTAVQDMPNGAQTAMKSDHETALVGYREKFDADTARERANFAADTSRYEEDLKAALVKADAAKQNIDGMRTKKIIAITLLATAIIAGVGAIIVAAALQLGPIFAFFAAAPFFIGSTVAGHYTYLFDIAVTQLAVDIAYPDLLPKPVLDLPAFKPPVYYPSRDLELQQTRLSAQNTFASKATLHELAQTNYSDNQIINYGLLDRVTAISPEKRPVFYAKCLRLIQADRKINEERSDYYSRANSEYHKLNREVSAWKARQDEQIKREEQSICNQEWDLQVRERESLRAHPGVLVRPKILAIAPTGNLFSRLELGQRRARLNDKRAECAGLLVRGEEQNKRWLQSTRSAIDSAYSSASDQLEQQFAQAKAAAV